MRRRRERWRGWRGWRGGVGWCRRRRCLRGVRGRGRGVKRRVEMGEMWCIWVIWYRYLVDSAVSIPGSDRDAATPGSHPSIHLNASLCNPEELLQQNHGNQTKQIEAALHNIHLPHLALLPRLPGNPAHRIPHKSLLSPHLLIVHSQPLTPIHPPIRQRHRVILHYTLGMQGVRNVAR